jgi:cell cycle checkpoint protein
MVIKANGITFYTIHNHIVNIILIVDATMFLVYNIYSDNTNIAFHLQVDIDLIASSFLSIDDTKTTCYLSYNGSGAPLVVEFDNSLISEKLEFSTYITELSLETDQLMVDTQDVQFELIIQSDVLLLMLQDLVKISTTELSLVISNKPNKLDIRNMVNSSTSINNNSLVFISKGEIGYSKLIYPNQFTILEKLLMYNQQHESIIDSITSTYNFSNFIKILKAVKLLSKCKLIKDWQGILSIQLLCNNTNNTSSFITFNMLEIIGENDGHQAQFPDDDELYNYVRDYGEVPLQKQSIPSTVGQVPMFI